MTERPLARTAGRHCGRVRRIAPAAAIIHLLAVSAGCASPPPPSAPRAPAAKPSAPVAVPSAPRPSQPPGKAEANEVVARALRQMAVLRDLPATGPVSAAVIGRQDMVQRIREQLHREVPPEAVSGTTTLLFAFGTVAASFDLERSLLDLMSAELAGFYEPSSKLMFLLADLNGPEREATLSHELVHALQDQHYDLGRLIAYRDDASDEQSALHALAEGDATSAMIDQMLAPRGMRAIDAADDQIGLQARGMMEANPRSSQVPGIIKRSVISSYADGLPFVHWARRRAGWPAVDAAWRRPPATTEQLLHPEKYLASEPAMVVPIPTAPPGGPSKLVYHDVQGEQSVRILLEEWVPARIAAESAAGWGGDRIAVFQEGGLSAVAWHLRYDDAASAKRGFVSIGRGILRAELEELQAVATPEFVPRERAERVTRSGRVCHSRSHRGAFAAVRKGSDVAVVAGPYGVGGASSRPTADCAAAVAWAQAIVKQR